MYRQAGLPERTLVASFTVPLQEEAADMRSVPLVMRIFPRHLLQHLLGRRRSELRVVGIGHHAGRRVGHLLFHDLGIEFCVYMESSGINQSQRLAHNKDLRLTLVDVRCGSRVDSPQSGIPDLSRQTVFPVERREIVRLVSPCSRSDYPRSHKHSQIEQARLTDVLDLGTGGTDLGLLEPGSTTGVPTKDGEGSYTDLEVGRRQLATRLASLSCPLRTLHSFPYSCLLCGAGKMTGW